MPVSTEKGKLTFLPFTAKEKLFGHRWITLFLTLQ